MIKNFIDSLFQDFIDLIIFLILNTFLVFGFEIKSMTQFKLKKKYKKLYKIFIKIKKENH